ncbi:uncharacterized protein LOC105837921 isoform X2 [Monomorium pharaonis]|uniref:uncharacterized protein LOC105837921 isoform X2 n=1 Tax=Monomorium pharaonis TaxID=307658 RepID=UPI00063F6509|nr:uncharacterized protein LOC105837921 isoform X2 [Monomorium pharaonis]
MEEIHVPVHNNSSSIEQTLGPISFMSWFMGVGIARPRKCSKVVTIIIRIVYLAVFLISMVYNMIELFDFDNVTNHMLSFMYFVNEAMFYVSTYYYIYHGIKQYDKWPKLMDKIKELDQKIRGETQISDQPVKKAVVVAILATLVCCLFLLIAEILLSFIYSVEILAYNLVFFYMSAQSFINSFVVNIVVYVLYYRFQAINKLIGRLDKSTTALWIALKIKHIRELHTDVCDLVIMVNDIYGLSLLLYTMNCFLTLVVSPFRIYVVVKEYYDNFYFILISIITWILCTTQFGVMCWICTRTCQESDKTGIIMSAVTLKCKPVNYDILHETGIQSGLEIQLDDLDNKQKFNWSHNLRYVIIENLLRRNLDRDCVRSEINDFSIQLQHRRIAFTACNFFEISNALFCGFIGMTITYLIVSIQFSK